MSEQKGHINLFSAKDIQRYLNGELSPAEMHAIEKAALDDPFLGDAIEGMEETMSAHGDSVINTNLESIQQQVKNRLATKNSSRVIVLRWWYAAAAVVLVTGSIWLYNGPAKKSPNGMVAQLTKKNQVKADSTVPGNAGVTSLYEKDKKGDADGVRDSFDQKTIADSKESRSSKKYRKQVVIQSKGNYYLLNKDTNRYLNYKDVSSAVRQKADTTEYKADVAGRSSAKREANGTEDLLKKQQSVEVSRFGNLQDSIETETVHVQPAAKAVAKANQDDKTKLHNVIKGRVADQFDNPLSNANVLRLDERVALTTDQYGFFRIPSNDSLVHVTVSVSGYTTQNVTLLSNAALNNIQLQPADGEVDRRNISSKGGVYESESFSGNGNAISNSHQDAQPVDGWVNFEQYLIKNKKPPTDNPNLKGQVVVSFVVNKKTGLSDFKVEQHLAKGYDEEAIRLVKDGPQWKLVKGRKVKVLVVVHF